MDWLISITAGLLAAPLGFVLGTLAAYGILFLRGVPEREGRRGLLAGTIGGPIGAIACFMLAFSGASWLREGGGGALRGLLAGALFGIPAGLLFGAIALIYGVHWAEDRGVTNYAGERAAWALYYVALPTMFVTAAGGFVLGWWITR